MIGIPVFSLNTVLIPFPLPSPPNQLPPPLSIGTPGSSRVVHGATYCGVVAVVQLHLLSSSHPQKVSPPLGAAAGQRRSHFRSDPASSPATLAQHFPIFIFRALLHQPFSGSAWQRLLRFGGELSEPPVGLPRIQKSSSGREKCSTLF